MASRSPARVVAALVVLLALRPAPGADAAAVPKPELRLDCWTARCVAQLSWLATEARPPAPVFVWERIPDGPGSLDPVVRHPPWQVPAPPPEIPGVWRRLARDTVRTGCAVLIRVTAAVPGLPAATASALPPRLARERQGESARQAGPCRAGALGSVACASRTSTMWRCG